MSPRKPCSSGKTRPLTVFHAAGRACLIGAGVGFDARVMVNTVPLLKRLFGRTGIGWTATLEWLRYEFPPIEVAGVDAEGRDFRREATFVVSANTARYGGDPILSPFADPEDDLLDLVLFASRSRRTLMLFYHHLSRGKAAHLADEGVSRMAVRVLHGALEVRATSSTCRWTATGRARRPSRSARRRGASRSSSRSEAAGRQLFR